MYDCAMMQVDIIYSETLELLLVLRQIFSGERFKPFSKSMERLIANLTEDDMYRIEDLGVLTNGYLSAISSIISQYCKFRKSDSSLLWQIASDPEMLFTGERDVVNDERVQEGAARLLSRYEESSKDRIAYGNLLEKVWSDGVCREKGNRSRWILHESEKLRNQVGADSVLPYLMGLSDRFSMEGETIRFKINPELKMKTGEIERILLMPSLFATRELTFWYEGKTLLFFIAPRSAEKGAAEPTDMHLLYTSALNDRTRLKMLKILAGGNRTAGALADQLKLNASTVSRHLKLFKDTGFIEIVSNDGRQIVYALNRNGINQAWESLKHYILY